MLKRSAKLAGIKKRMHSHIFRHSRITDLDRKRVPQKMIRHWVDWSERSAMPSVYTHYSKEEAYQTVQSVCHKEVPMPAVQTVEEPTERVCVRCDHTNTRENEFCAKCGYPLI